MWLKATFEEKKNTTPEDPYTYDITVDISDEKIAPVDTSWNTFRLSPIFPLKYGIPIPNISNCQIHFFNYSNAYRVLGRLDKIATAELKSQSLLFNGVMFCHLTRLYWTGT